jgi:acylphosphatase
VGFRYATRQQAGRLGLGGWVRNLGDGTVEAVFEGAAADVAQAVTWCRYGPPGAWVSAVKRETETPIGETSFRERPTEYGTPAP